MPATTVIVIFVRSIVGKTTALWVCGTREQLGGGGDGQDAGDEGEAEERGGDGAGAAGGQAECAWVRGREDHSVK